MTNNIEEIIAGRLAIARELEDVLSVQVKVSGGEVMRIIVRDLVAKRKACKDEELQYAFDTVLLGYFLTADELKAALNDQ